jgi:hypothetical protein
MKWKLATAKTTKINRATTAPRHELEYYCRDLISWPRSWMGLEKDLPPGEELLRLFRPFLEHLAASNLSPKTIQKHVDNMWAPGRGVHSRSPQRPCFETTARGPGPFQDDRIRRTALVSRR